MLEALEFLLEKNYIFERTFYIAFGHDEEVHRQIFFFGSGNIDFHCKQVFGHEGAGQIAKHLQRSGVGKLDFILDEGYFVLQDMINGVDELVSV